MKLTLNLKRERTRVVLIRGSGRDDIQRYAIIYMRIISEEMSSWTALTMYDNKDNILDQIYIKKMCSDFFYEDLKF